MQEDSPNQHPDPESTHRLPPPPPDIITQNTPAPQPNFPTPKAQKMINGSNCLSQTFFTWVYELLSRAQQEDVDIKSIPTLPAHLKADFQLQQYLTMRRQLSEKGLLSLLLRMFGRDIGILVLLSIVVEVFYLSYPILIYFNIDFIQNRKQDTSYGILLFSLTILASFFYNLTFTNLKYRFKGLGVNLSTHLNLLIFHKALNYSMVAQKGFSQSDIIGYSQVDTDNLMYVGSRLAYFVFGSVEILAGFGLLYWFVGLAFIAGLVVLLLLSSLTFIISSCNVSATEKALESRDQRLSVTGQLLNLIRFVKINAMEKFFYKRIQEQREKELMSFKRKGMIEVVLVFFYCVTAPLFLTATIVTYFIIHGQITSAQVFTTMMIAVVFEVTAQQMPKACSELLAVLRSIERIDAFLQAPEIDGSKYNRRPEHTQDAIAVNINGDFFVGSEQINGQPSPEKQAPPAYVGFNVVTNDMNPEYQLSDRILNKPSESQEKQKGFFLKDINLKIESGKLYMIYGDIGSGKSMLLLSILNELNKANQASIQVNGKIAYVSQKPWVLSGTIQDNIYFTFDKDQAKLQQAIRFACLEEDISQLPNGRKTEIGQNGINLSNGQKFRVDIARSLYSQSDIYLYDDVLSAVDIHVGTSLMEDTILDYLKGKTIVMATHALKFASLADYIIFMKDGRVIACDKYQEISKIPQFHEVELKLMERERQKKVESNEEVKSIIMSIIEEERVQLSIPDSSERPSAASEKLSLVQQLMLPEEQQKGSVSQEIFKEYVKLNGGYVCFLGLILLCFLMYSVLQTASSIFLSLWAQDSSNMRNLYIFIGLTFSANLFIFLQAIVLLLSGVRQGREVHNNIVKGLLYASLTDFFNRVPVGRILNRLGKDLKELDESIAPNFSSFLISLFRIFSSIFICIYTSTPYALIPIALVAVVFIRARIFYLRGQQKLVRLQKVTNSPLVVSFTNGIRGAASIRCYSSCEYFLRSHIQLVNDYRRVLLSHFAASGWFLMVLVYVGYIVNMFCIGYCMFNNSNDNPAYIGLLLAYILNMNDQIYSFVLEEAEFETQLISLERLYHITQLPPQKRYVEYCKDWKQEQQQILPLFSSGEIEFKHVSVRYRASLPRVLKNITCKIKSGEKIGIVGRTGSGKTTLLNTLIGITELTEGQLIIDSRRISDIPLKELRREITVIDQQPVLINSTFRQNLDVFNQYKDEELIKVAQDCSIWKIMERRGGLYGKVTNDTLSAGEKQLICICRALLKNTKIVLIDEATANIDVTHDYIIQKVLAQKFADKTLLTIAHRLSTLKDYDRIMVMEGGKLLQFDSPEQLMKSRGIYYQMMSTHGTSPRHNAFA